MSNLREIFPDFLAESLDLGIAACGRKIHGFDRPDAILSGVESRTSSPVRISRNEQMESNVRGFYPCGEGAGYAEMCIRDSVWSVGSVIVLRTQEICWHLKCLWK